MNGNVTTVQASRVLGATPTESVKKIVLSSFVCVSPASYILFHFDEIAGRIINYITNSPCSQPERVHEDPMSSVPDELQVGADASVRIIRKVDMTHNPTPREVPASPPAPPPDTP